MLHRRTYQVIPEEDNKLVYEEIQNKNGQILSYKDHQAPFKYEEFYEYNEAGLLSKSYDLEEDLENSRTEIYYDEHQRIINQKIFVAGELFEEIIKNYSGNKSIETHLQYGEEVRKIEEISEEDSYSKLIFENGELVEKHSGKFSNNKQTETTTITDSEGNLLFTKTIQYDIDGNQISLEERNQNENLMLFIESDYDNGKLKVEKYDDYVNYEHGVITREYDKIGNLLKEELKSSSGKLLEFHNKAYDQNNRLISESGYSVGSFNAVYGNYVNGQNYHFIHEYEVIN
ncbi:hypothetical protein [Marinigracilibium pacificum]|uniref:YD repeat-containing protein n=1 Tax=Marinigracilibium pacificum TaxID=2729599 RepID=A0A848IZN2_9BACT|nr:hypothetical protein [Marinigracilibium pacificum]NMM47449.1 hypothetical protein [Marinigracilibium pacificum]